MLLKTFDMGKLASERLNAPMLAPLKQAELLGFFHFGGGGELLKWPWSGPQVCYKFLFILVCGMTLKVDQRVSTTCSL